MKIKCIFKLYTAYFKSKSQKKHKITVPEVKGKLGSRCYWI